MSTSSHYKPVNPENDTCSFNRLHSNPLSTTRTCNKLPGVSPVNRCEGLEC